MVKGSNWQPTCRLNKPLPETNDSQGEIADIEIANHGSELYRIGDNQNDPDYNHALEFLHDQISKIEVTID